MKIKILALLMLLQVSQFAYGKSEVTNANLLPWVGRYEGTLPFAGEGVADRCTVDIKKDFWGQITVTIAQEAGVLVYNKSVEAGHEYLPTVTLQVNKYGTKAFGTVEDMSFHHDSGFLNPKRQSVRFMSYNAGMTVQMNYDEPVLFGGSNYGYQTSCGDLRKL